jgi:hypothetical protein
MMITDTRGLEALHTEEAVNAITHTFQLARDAWEWREGSVNDRECLVASNQGFNLAWTRDCSMVSLWFELEHFLFSCPIMCGDVKPVAKIIKKAYRETYEYWKRKAKQAGRT